MCHFNADKIQKSNLNQSDIVRGGGYSDKHLGECGRTMLEMLAVLAIIGLLTIASMLGFSYAMRQYRENETVNEFSKVIAASRTGFLKENYMVKMAEGDDPLIVPIREMISGVDFNRGRVCPDMYINNDPDYCQKTDAGGRTAWEESFRSPTGADISVQIESPTEFAVLLKGLGATADKYDEGLSVCQKVVSYDFGQDYVYASLSGEAVLKCGTGDAGAGNAGYTPGKLSGDAGASIVSCLCQEALSSTNKFKLSLFFVFDANKNVGVACETKADCSVCQKCQDKWCVRDENACQCIGGVLRANVMGDSGESIFPRLSQADEADCCPLAMDDDNSGSIVYYDVKAGQTDCCSLDDGWVFEERSAQRHETISFLTPNNSKVFVRQGECCQGECPGDEVDCCQDEAKKICGTDIPKCEIYTQESGEQKPFGCSDVYYDTSGMCCPVRSVVYEDVENHKVGCCPSNKFVEYGPSSQFYRNGNPIKEGRCGGVCGQCSAGKSIRPGLKCVIDETQDCCPVREGIDMWYGVTESYKCCKPGDNPYYQNGSGDLKCCPAEAWVDDSSGTDNDAITQTMGACRPTICDCIRDGDCPAVDGVDQCCTNCQCGPCQTCIEHTDCPTGSCCENGVCGACCPSDKPNLCKDSCCADKCTDEYCLVCDPDENGEKQIPVEDDYGEFCCPDEMGYQIEHLTDKACVCGPGQFFALTMYEVIPCWAGGGSGGSGSSGGGPGDLSELPSCGSTTEICAIYGPHYQVKVNKKCHGACIGQSYQVKAYDFGEQCCEKRPDENGNCGAACSTSYSMGDECGLSDLSCEGGSCLKIGYTKNTLVSPPCASGTPTKVVNGKTYCIEKSEEKCRCKVSGEIMQEDCECPECPTDPEDQCIKNGGKPNLKYCSQDCSGTVACCESGHQSVDDAGVPCCCVGCK